MCEASCGRDWSGEVIIRLNQLVVADLPFMMTPRDRRDMKAAPGEHAGEANQHGALAVRTKGGKLLGVKPAEVSWWRYTNSMERYVWGQDIWVSVSEEFDRLLAIREGEATDGHA